MTTDAGHAGASGSEAIGTLRADIARFLSHAAESAVDIQLLRLIGGGSSQEMWALDVQFDSGAYAGAHALVMRRDLGGAIIPTALTRAEEFRVYQAMYAAGIAVPRPYWCADGAEGIAGRAAFFAQRLVGEAIGRRVVREPALTSARAVLPAQLAAQLARIHTLDPSAVGLDFLPAPFPGLSAALTGIERLERQLQSIDEPHPALELALRWLRCHAPPTEHVVVVHGDYRIGNMLVGSEGLRAVLDWEFAHLGDAREDVGWGCVRAWRFGQDHLRFGGIAALEVFLEAYAKAGGKHFTPEDVHFWEVLGNVGWAIGALAQARRHLDGQERSIEFASLGRVCAEMELELLHLIERG